MVHDLLYLLHDSRILRAFQVASEAVLLHHKTQVSLPCRDIPIHVLVGKIPLETQEGVQRLEEQNVVSRQTVIFDIFAIDEPADAPTLEALDITQPDGARDAGVCEVLVKNPEQVAEAEGDNFQVLKCRLFVVFFEADDSADHLEVYWESLDDLSTVGTMAAGGNFTYQDFQVVEHAKEGLLRSTHYIGHTNVDLVDSLAA